MRSCDCAGGVIGGADSVRLARWHSVGILFAERAQRIESHGVLGGYMRRGKLVIATDMPTSPRRK
jgi:hypothetical protein